MLGPNPLHYRRNLACRISPPADQSELSIRCIIGLQDNAGVITPDDTTAWDYTTVLPSRNQLTVYQRHFYAHLGHQVGTSWPSSSHILAIKFAHLGHKVGKSWPSSSHILAIKFAHLIHQVRTTWPSSLRILTIEFVHPDHRVCAS